MTPVCVGIDPGREGAMALLWPDGKHLVFDLPWLGKDLDCQRTKAWLPSGTLTAAIEYQQVFPRQGAVSAFTTGCSYGQLLGLFLGLGVPFETPRPAVWKKNMAIPAKSDKSVSVMLARRLFPDAELVSPRGKLLDGRAEALLLAEWLRRRNGGRDVRE